MNRRLHLLPVFLLLAWNLALANSPYPIAADALCDYTVTGVVTPCTATPPNGAVDITVTPPDNYTYAWSNGATTEDITDLPGGTYTVTVTLVGNCSTITEFVVIAYTPGPLTVTGQVTPDTCAIGVGGVNLSVWSGVPPFTFTWSNGSHSEDLTGITGPSSFFVTVTDANGGIQVLDFFVNNTNNFFNNNINNYYSLSTSDNTTCNSPPNGGIVYTPLSSIPFNWNWSNGGNSPTNPNLSAGNYMATVTLGNCTQSWNPNIAIFDTPNNPGIAVAPVDAICGASNGQVNLSVISGVSPYTFAWSNADGSFSATTEDISNIPAGDYSVTVTGGNACTYTTSISLSNINLNINLNGTVQPNTSCTNANGSIVTNIQPSSPPSGFSYSYTWSNGLHTPGISGLVAGNYTVTVTVGNTCSATASFSVGNGAQLPTLSVATTAEDCEGPGSVDLSVSGGMAPFGYLWSNGATTQDLPSAMAGNYSVTVTAADGCSATITAIVEDNNPGADTTYVTGTTCDPLGVGTSVLTLTGAGGCDSLIITTLSFAASDTTLLFGNSCAIAQSGIFEQSLTNQSGCDSIVITTITYVGSDTTNLSATSCDMGQVGVFQESLTNQFGCDSIVVTTISFAASDTTALFGNTCDIGQAGIFEQVLTNVNGCDSLVITTIQYVGSDTTAYFETSCDLSQVGVFEQNLTNQFGCDSIIVTTITYSAADTTLFFDTSCDLSDVGVFEQSLTNGNGCDSVIITTITYAAADTTAIFENTCDSQVAGVFEQTLTNSNGCDSVVITTITLAASDTTELFGTSCNPGSVGVFTQNLVNAAGCDSTVVTTITYSLSDTTLVSSTTCDPAQAGIFTQNLTTVEGCDSVVVTTVSLLPSSVTMLAGTTCIQSEAGVFTDLQTNWLGCDSLIIGTITFVPSSSTNLTATTCDPSQVGFFTEILTNWQGCDSIVTTTVTLLPSSSTNLTATTCDASQVGVFTETLTNWLGCDSVVTTTVSMLPHFSLIVNNSNFNGYGVTCAGANDGWVDLIVAGGTSPFTYQWSNGYDTPLADSLEAGSYSATVTDGNGCSQITGIISLLGPSPLQVSLNDHEPDCNGPLSGSITVTASGGVSSYLYSMDGNWQSSNVFGGLGAGTYEIYTQDANGCTSVNSTIIDATEPLSIDLGEDQIIDEGESVSLQIHVNVPIGTLTNVQWFGIGAVVCPHCLEQEIFPTETKVYYVTVEDEFGCMASDSVSVEVIKNEPKSDGIYVPTAFSPNKDGYNDFLTVYAVPTVRMVKSFAVYDNWGDLVFEYYNFEPNHLNYGWDGRQKGRLMQYAVFLWIAEVEFTNGEIKKFAGTTELIR